VVIVISFGRGGPLAICTSDVERSRAALHLDLKEISLDHFLAITIYSMRIVEMKARLLARSSAEIFRQLT